MPNTTNFNFPTPADTDLVKDGASAIRSLGNSIDTAFVDLKGGTTGQVLSKNSNTDLDYTWVTPNVGDITEVQAGTGISVASGTGPIPVVTNSMATEITAKGDLIVGTGSGTFDNLAVGTNGHTLVADSSTSTGLKWAAAAASGLTLIKTETIGSGVTSVTVTSAFNSTYDNYRIIISGGAGSAGDTIDLELGTANTGYSQLIMEGNYSSNTLTTTGRDNQSKWLAVGRNSTNTICADFELQSPNLATRTHFLARAAGGQAGAGGVVFHTGGFLNNTTQFTSFKISTASASTMTGGTIRVYGYANS